jgi:hypothetical protein
MDNAGFVTGIHAVMSKRTNIIIIIIIIITSAAGIN